MWAKRLAPLGIMQKCLLSRGVNRHVPRLAKLGATNSEHPLSEIDILAVKMQGLVGAHPSDCIQTQQGGIGVRSQPG